MNKLQKSILAGLPFFLAFLFLSSCGQLDESMEGRHPGWRELRAEHVLREPACRCCGSTERLEVHHVLPVSWRPDLELDPNNLVTLCRRCHQFIGHLDDWKSYNPKVREDADAWRKRIMTRPSK